MGVSHAYIIMLYIFGESSLVDLGFVIELEGSQFEPNYAPGRA